jgi:hypothetical protein
VSDTRSIEQQLSDLQDRYNVLRAEHKALSTAYEAAMTENRRVNAELDNAREVAA